VLDIAAAYRRAGDGKEVGGDFYDLFEVSGEDWVLTIGDVCGKGAEAAVVTALARYTIRAAAARHTRPTEVLGVLNDVLERHDSKRFCTVVVARLHRSEHGWEVTFASGGHPLPLLLQDGLVPRPIGTHGTMVGAFEDPTFDDSVVDLAPGDGLVFYTDGVTEARRRDAFFGLPRLQSTLEGSETAAVMVERVLGEVLEFQRGRAADDIAIVVLRVPPGDPGTGT
jgi:sigma-B regulation protein RsbU (phosphoserine phosphatase)